MSPDNSFGLNSPGRSGIKHGSQAHPKASELFRCNLQTLVDLILVSRHSGNDEAQDQNPAI